MARKDPSPRPESKVLEAKDVRIAGSIGGIVHAVHADRENVLEAGNEHGNGSKSRSRTVLQLEAVNSFSRNLTFLLQ